MVVDKSQERSQRPKSMAFHTIRTSENPRDDSVDLLLVENQKQPRVLNRTSQSMETLPNDLIII